MSKVIAFVLSLVSLGGVFKGPAPLPEAFAMIYQKPYVAHVYDCSNMCASYLFLLRKSGYTDARIGVFGKRYGQDLHAVVWADNAWHDITNNMPNIINPSRFGKFQYWVSEYQLEHHWEYTIDKKELSRYEN